MDSAQHHAPDTVFANGERLWPLCGGLRAGRSWPKCTSAHRFRQQQCAVVVEVDANHSQAIRAIDGEFAGRDKGWSSATHLAIVKQAPILNRVETQGSGTACEGIAAAVVIVALARMPVAPNRRADDQYLCPATEDVSLVPRLRRPRNGNPFDAWWARRCGMINRHDCQHPSPSRWPTASDRPLASSFGQ